MIFSIGSTMLIGSSLFFLLAVWSCMDMLLRYVLRGMDRLGWLEPWIQRRFARCHINITSSHQQQQQEVPKQPQDIVVYQRRFWLRLAENPSLGFGEGYMDGDWNSPKLEACLTALLGCREMRVAARPSWNWHRLLLNAQSIGRSRKVAKVHYDVGNDLYAAMLDPRLQYSCGWWPPSVNTLEEAQLLKIKVLCAKLQLHPGMRVLDIGCGWGGLLDYMQRHHGVIGIGLTLSKEQVKLGRQRFPTVEFVLQDYREYCATHRGCFDRIVSVGMFEHVGPSNYRTFFEACRSALVPDDSGLLLLHTIGCDESTTSTNEWIDKYIFPGGVLPSIRYIGQAIERSFVMEDWQNVGPYYARTLREWKKRSSAFFRAQKRDNDDDRQQYSLRFQRMWKFYLVSCKVLFDLRKLQLWQIVLTPAGFVDRVTHRKTIVPRYDGIPIRLDANDQKECEHFLVLDLPIDKKKATRESGDDNPRTYVATDDNNRSSS